MFKIACTFLGRFYQIVISPVIHALFGAGQGCRFTPSCSQYARQAVEVHGGVRGGWMAFCRICRCNPFSRSGYDPVRVTHEAILKPTSKVR